MPSWERIARLADLSDRRAVRAERGGHPLCLSLADGSPVAVADVCAHRSTALSGGLVRDGILTCPGHFWRYDLRTGELLPDLELRSPIARTLDNCATRRSKRSVWFSCTGIVTVPTKPALVKSWRRRFRVL